MNDQADHGFNPSPQGKPSDEDRTWLENLVIGDPALDGGGFMMEDHQWVIWLMTADPAAETAQPRELRGYPVRFRRGPARWMRDGVDER
ncbi:hypothetical protein [Amycolatopsis sp. DG1A-15b]|uniref:hypothetical protein n=1 Tax=Amycolatopsis sp. DG1A-15b TaxID=3052846 RepID=UPI00255BBF7E|nr:hypothetical protein [Amycolatopsis sp. DG1A-15b]WIX91325.1 hypothetical protein QRY02_13085 [Amycolatopsis sp. DG1A-15b]